jgi:hypothetical protein
MDWLEGESVLIQTYTEPVAMDYEGLIGGIVAQCDLDSENGKREAYNICVEYAKECFYGTMDMNPFIKLAASKFGQIPDFIDSIKGSLEVSGDEIVNVQYSKESGVSITGNREGLQLLARIFAKLSQAKLEGEHVYFEAGKFPLAGNIPVSLNFETEEWFANLAALQGMDLDTQPQGLPDAGATYQSPSPQETAPVDAEMEEPSQDDKEKDKKGHSSTQELEPDDFEEVPPVEVLKPRGGYKKVPGLYSQVDIPAPKKLGRKSTMRILAYRSIEPADIVALSTYMEPPAQFCMTVNKVYPVLSWKEYDDEGIFRKVRKGNERLCVFAFKRDDDKEQEIAFDLDDAAVKFYKEEDLKNSGIDMS